MSLVKFLDRCPSLMQGETMITLTVFQQINMNNHMKVLWKTVSVNSDVLGHTHTHTHTHTHSLWTWCRLHTGTCMCIHIIPLMSEHSCVRPANRVCNWTGGFFSGERITKHLDSFQCFPFVHKWCKSFSLHHSNTHFYLFLPNVNAAVLWNHFLSRHGQTQDRG